MNLVGFLIYIYITRDPNIDQDLFIYLFFSSDTWVIKIQVILLWGIISFTEFGLLVNNVKFDIHSDF